MHFVKLDSARYYDVVSSQVECCRQKPEGGALSSLEKMEKALTCLNASNMKALVNRIKSGYEEKEGWLGRFMRLIGFASAKQKKVHAKLALRKISF